LCRKIKNKKRGIYQSTNLDSSNQETSGQLKHQTNQREIRLRITLNVRIGTDEKIDHFSMAPKNNTQKKCRVDTFLAFVRIKGFWLLMQ